MAVMILLGLVRPLATNRENNVEMLNNFLVMIICYCLYCFTDFLTDLEWREITGFAMIALLTFYIVFNLILITITSIVAAKDAYRKRKIQLKVKATMRK